MWLNENSSLGWSQARACTRPVDVTLSAEAVVQLGEWKRPDGNRPA